MSNPMTDTTDIKALRPSERAKLGFVTDDNTGGYYVAECEECGKIFPSQTCDGGEQIADSGDYGDCYCPHCGFIDPLECDNANLVWNVQQLKIVNLTKQLEAERQRADELERLVHVEASSFANERVRADKLAAHIEALKGEQVPVGEIVAWNHSNEERKVDFRFLRFDVQPGTKLFTAPQKPVVLPGKITRGFVELAEMYGCEPAQAQFIAVGWNAAIEAAGGIVKDGE